MEIRLLGPVQITVDRAPLPLHAAKPRALLAMLALGAGAPVSVERLVDGLWGERPPASSHKLVQLYVSQLRKLLASSAILTRDSGYELCVLPDSVDALRFERLVATAERRAVQEALALWRGPPLHGLADQPFAAAEIRRLEDLYERARELAVEDALASGDGAAYVSELQELVVRYPLRERLRAQLMLALYRSGRQAEALDAFLDARRALVEELGIEPGRELRELHQAILAQDPGLDRPAAHRALPAGTVTFLAAVVEHSTRRSENPRTAMADAVERYHALLDAGIARNRGVPSDEQGGGDSVVAAFAHPGDAVRAAIECQRALSAETWPEGIVVRARMAILTDGATNSSGCAIVSCTRLCALACGGQVLLSGTTRELVQNDLPTGAGLVELGPHRLGDPGPPEHIYALTHPQLQSVARLPSEEEPARVPLPPTRTVGRDADLRRVRVALANARLVTITGPGGVGKTRLAIEAARVAGRAVFVSLAAIAAAEDVASAIVRALEVEPRPAEPPDATLLRALTRRELLLVLDNFEHVLDAAGLVSRLVEACPGVTVLATSREPLRVRAERVLQLAPLAPEAAAEQFTMLLAAHDQREGDPAAVYEICRRLDGLPLAIELAAGRIGLLSVEELALRLRSGLTALGPGARDAPPRQRTLAATLTWSYDLARPEERAALVALSIFAGGCTLEAAEYVTGAPLDVLDALVAKNLAIARDGRVWLLETIRAFARERLVDEAVSRRHAEHYTALAERTQPELARTGAPELLDPEIDNFRGALRWTLDHGETELALRLATGLNTFWLHRHLSSEAVRWLTAGLDAGPVAPTLRARALTALSRHLPDVSHAAEAEAAAHESLALRRELGDTTGCAETLCALAQIKLAFHHVEEAYALATEAERLATEYGAAQVALDARQVRAMMAPTLDEALTTGERVLAELHEAGNRRRYAAVVASLAYTALFHDDPATARRLSEQALTDADPGDRFAVALAEGNAGLAALFEGDIARSRSAFGHALRIGADDHHADLVAEAVYGLAAIAAVDGRDEHAAALWGAVQRLDTTGADPLIAARIEARFFDPARARLGPDTWQAASRRLDRDAAIEAAMALTSTTSDQPLGLAR